MFHHTIHRGIVYGSVAEWYATLVLFECRVCPKSDRRNFAAFASTPCLQMGEFYCTVWVNTSLPLNHIVSGQTRVTYVALDARDTQSAGPHSLTRVHDSQKSDSTDVRRGHTGLWHIRDTDETVINCWMWRSAHPNTTGL